MSVQRFLRSSRLRVADERGTALITALLVMMLMSALMIGFTTAVMTEQRSRFVDKDRSRAFYAAQSGLEKLTADLAGLFFVNVAPDPADVDALKNDPPVVPGARFAADGVAKPYGVSIGTTATGDITTGPYQGLKAIKTEYTLDSAVKTDSGGEAHLQRRLETVAIPVFQFGMFSDVDLSFSAAADYNFGGRVHTNKNLYLAQGGSSPSTLWLADRVTAVGEIVRQRLSNGNSIDDSGSTRPVKVATAPGAYRDLARTEGSVVDGIGSGANPNWTTISLSTYNGYLRTGKTGAKALNLPLITTGGINYDLIKRPPAGEDVTKPKLFAERDFTRVSMRILLSDTANDILTLPTVTSAPPVRLDGNWAATPPSNGTGNYVVTAATPPIARSPGQVSAAINAVAAGATTITAPATLPAAFRTAWFEVKKGTGTTYYYYCTGITTTTLTGCTSDTNPASSLTTVAPIPTVTGFLYDPETGTTQSLGPINLGTSFGSPWSTITVATNTTAFQTMFPVKVRNLFVERLNGSHQMVSCTGATNTKLTGCSGVTAALVAGDVLTNASQLSVGTGVIGGYIKIELQDTNETWSDVTMEILNWGIAGPNLGGRGCGDPSSSAILRIQRLRDNLEPGASPPCSYTGTTKSTDFWPNALFDSREGAYRDANPGDAAGTVRMLGVMYYVTLDIGNLSKWFQATAPYVASTGPNGLKNNNGFSVYFSDRRSNRNASNIETGEFGFEDEVNPASGTGAPNGVLDQGEDVNADNALQQYGKYPSWDGVYSAVPAGGTGYYNVNARVWDAVKWPQAQVNRAYYFRRALKLTNGGLGNVVMPGLTIVSENPVYIQGDYNANQAGWGTPNAAAAVIADSVTLLSNGWNDRNSFTSPYDANGRARSSDTWYRLAIIAGKGPIFPNPNGAGATFGTDGGAHSFLRFLEGAAGNNLVHYKGSLVTFYYHRQAISPFKCCGGIVYDVPARDYTFDQTFLDLGRLPPLTPVFRDVNARGFTQETRPGK